ncbi:unnamed protein product [Cochlearia groenlandica]
MDKHKLDIISSLPLELLLYIISFLPFQSARLTPFLSTRFSYVWNQALVISHIMSHKGSSQDISCAVSTFINNFDEQDPSKNTRKMELHFEKSTLVSTILAPNDVMHMRFFLSLLSSDCKKEESSFPMRLGINEHIPRRVDSRSGFLVKTLCLDSVNSMTHEAVSSMVSGFSLLEKLKICGCRGLTSLTIDSLTKLLHLSISDCPKLTYLDIRSCKLKTLHLNQGYLPLIKINEHFNLTNAIFDVREGPSYRNNAFDIDPILLIIKNSQSLTLCRWMFEELMRPSISSSWTSYQFYKLQELHWIEKSMNQENINLLISFLKLCPSIERIFITIDSNTCSSSKEDAIVANNVSNHTRILKKVKFEGTKNHENDKKQLILAIKKIVNIDQLLCDDIEDYV